MIVRRPWRRFIVENVKEAWLCVVIVLVFFTLGRPGEDTIYKVHEDSSTVNTMY